jgi:hypothetical protein
MMPPALKGAWVIHAGVVPGKADPRFTKRYEYTSKDAAADDAHRSDAEYQSIFAMRRVVALDYFAQVSMPHINNWASIQFTWY